MENIDPISLSTAVVRILILVPLISFMHTQSRQHGNGDLSRVRRATLLVDLALVLMMGNIVMVNVLNGLSLDYPVAFVRHAALITSMGLGIALWYLWGVFRSIQYHSK